MRYKAGDLVQIKTWGRMMDEYGGMLFDKIEGRRADYISTRPRFTSEMEYAVQKLNCNRVLTIKESKINRMGDKDVSCYFMKEMGYSWNDKMIECLAEEGKIPIKISNRFEILDLR